MNQNVCAVGEKCSTGIEFNKLVSIHFRMTYLKGSVR